MRFIDPIKISYRNITATKLRSFLTVLGVIIGVASVIIVLAIGASAQALILDQVKGVGSNLIGVLPGASDQKGPPASALGVVTTTLKYEDLKALNNPKNIPDIISACGYVTGSANMAYLDQSFVTTYQGVSSSYPEVEKLDLGSGRFFLPEEETNLARVAVLGYNRAKDLFGDEDPINKKINIKDLNFTVVGVIDKRGSQAFSNPDDNVYMPLMTGQKLLLGINYLNFIRAKVNDEKNISRAINDVTLLIRNRHQIQGDMEDDFSVRSTAQALSILSSVTDVLKYFLVSIAAISLLVGGVGIMNIMLIAVNQRIREIGLRKALGAKNIHIIVQFIIESVTITLCGGVLGILMGILVTFLAYLIINQLGYEWQFIVTASSIVLAFFITLAVGIIFGLYPALRASKVSPIEALRYE